MGIQYKYMDDLITGIRALGGSGANLLVGASGAGIRLPRILRLRSRAICATADKAYLEILVKTSNQAWIEKTTRSELELVREALIRAYQLILFTKVLFPFPLSRDDAEPEKSTPNPSNREGVKK
jgi:hypothetical protein